MKRMAVACIAFVSICTSSIANEEAARQAAHRFKETYWDCLAKETVKALPMKLSGPDFAIYIRPKCAGERMQFNTALVDFLAMKFPDVPMQTHLTQAQSTIQAAIDDVASSYVQTRAGIDAEAQKLKR